MLKCSFNKILLKVKKNHEILYENQEKSYEILGWGIYDNSNICIYEI